MLAADLGLSDQAKHVRCAQHVTDVKRMLTGLIRRLALSN